MHNNEEKDDDITGKVHPRSPNPESLVMESVLDLVTMNRQACSREWISTVRWVGQLTAQRMDFSLKAQVVKFSEKGKSPYYFFFCQFFPETS
ncbi:hypothetical protein Chor_002748 [Crotalus horridus]